MTDEKDSEFGFAEFFWRISTGLVQAQRTLDAESLRYNIEARKLLGPAPPVAGPINPQTPALGPGYTQFRIPSLRARMSVDVVKNTKGTFNLVILRGELSKTVQIHQEVEFTIEAVTLPPVTNLPAVAPEVKPPPDVVDDKKNK